MYSLSPIKASKMWRGMVAVLRAVVGFWLLGAIEATRPCDELKVPEMPQPELKSLSDKTSSFMATTVNNFLSVVQSNAFPSGLVLEAVGALKDAKKMEKLLEEKNIEKALNGMASVYFRELLHSYAPPRSLRSAEQAQMEVPRTNRCLRRDCAFSVAGPDLWNDLPLNVRQAPYLSIFKTRLKTHLYSQAFDLILSYEIGFVVCAVIGILYILVMPVVGSVLACCRCAGNCGGEMYQKQTDSIFTQRRNLYWSTAIITIFLFAGNMCMFGSNDELKMRVTQSKQQLNDTFENIQEIIRNLKTQIAFVNLQSKAILDKVIKSIKEHLLISILGKDNADTIKNMPADVKSLQQLVKALNTEVNNVATRFAETQGKISKSLDQLQTAGVCSECGTLKTEVEGITIPTQSNTDTVDSINTQLNNNNPSSKFDDVTNGFNVDDTKQKLSDQVEDLSQKLKLNEKVAKVKKMQDDINRYTPLVDYPESIRWRSCIGMCFVVLLVVLCNILGLILGRPGLKQTQEPTERSNMANWGGIIFMTGASLSFLFSWLLMLAVTVLFLLGGNVHTLVCEPWSNGELLNIANKIPDFDLSTMLPQNVKVNLSELYSECAKKKSLWSTLKLGESMGSGIDEKLNVKEHTGGLKDINTPDVYDANLKRDVDQAQRDFKPVDNTKLDNTIQDFRTKASKPGTNPQKKKVFETAARDLEAIRNSINKNIKPKMNQVKKTLANIKDKLESSQNALQSDITAKVKTFVEEELSIGLMCITYMIKEEFGGCYPLAEVIDSAQSILCSYLVSSLNAFWFSLGWCLVFFIPSIILSMKLAKHYRRMKYSDTMANIALRPEVSMRELGSSFREVRRESRRSAASTRKPKRQEMRTTE